MQEIKSKHQQRWLWGGQGNQTLDAGQWISLSVDKNHSVQGGRQEEKHKPTMLKGKTKTEPCLQRPEIIQGHCMSVKTTEMVWEVAGRLSKKTFHEFPVHTHTCQELLSPHHIYRIRIMGLEREQEKSGVCCKIRWWQTLALKARDRF